MKKWHIVYPYKQPTDKGFGWELLYSIRSLHKNLNGDFDITIIGDIPEWIDSTKVNCVQLDNYHIEGQRQTRINQKILRACEFFDDFIVFNDDIHIMKPIDIEVLTIPRFIGGDLEFKDRDLSRSNAFRTQMKNAWLQLKDLGKQHKTNFVSHCPHYYETKKLKEVQQHINLTPLGYPKTVSVVLEQVYFNFFGQKGLPAKGFRFGCWGAGVCKEQYEGQEVLNYDEKGAGFNPWIKELLEKEFPEKCEVEL